MPCAMLILLLGRVRPNQLLPPSHLPCVFFVLLSVGFWSQPNWIETCEKVDHFSEYQLEIRNQLESSSPISCYAIEHFLLLLFILVLLSDLLFDDSTVFPMSSNPLPPYFFAHWTIWCHRVSIILSVSLFCSLFWLTYLKMSAIGCFPLDLTMIDWICFWKFVFFTQFLNRFLSLCLSIFGPPRLPCWCACVRIRSVCRLFYFMAGVREVPVGSVSGLVFQYNQSTYQPTTHPPAHKHTSDKLSVKD